MLTQHTIDGFESVQYQNFRALKQIEDQLGRLFFLSGYHQVATPTFEAYDFFRPEDGLSENSLFKLIDHNGKILVLKPDATLQIARMAAINHHDPKEIVKFYYRTKLYRNFSGPDTLKKETTQMGIEYFGNHSPECDGEIIALAIQSLLTIGITDIHIDIGHVGFINHLLNDIDLTGEEKQILLKLIETKNIGDIKSFLKARSFGDEINEIILKLPRLYGDPESVFNAMIPLCVNDKMRIVSEELMAVYRHLETIGLAQYITFDIGFTSQMSYYTDLIFKAYISNWGEPVIGGGRYDALSKRFGIDRPACGFGIDLLQMMDYLDQQHLLSAKPFHRSILLYTSDQKSECYRIVNALRQQDIPAEMLIAEGDPAAAISRIKLNPLYHDADYYYLSAQKCYLWNEGSKQFESIDSVEERAVKK